MSGQAPGSGKRDLAYWAALSALLNVTLTGIAVILLRWPSPAAIEIETPAPISTASAGLMPVYVSGAVMQTGVYWLPQGALVEDALLAAGGASCGADREAGNHAQRVWDGAHCHLPLKGESIPTPVANSSSVVRININSASAQELEALPGIGPALAARIVAYRQEQGPFSTIEELGNVSGIGPRTLDQLRPFITTR
ncbi:MAG: helix-hairpin-helix domain-containing protein [Anaerolineae bacterium]